MRVGIHADPAAHQIPGGIGVYVLKLIEELLVQGIYDYRLIISAGAEIRSEWAELVLPQPKIPVGVLYGLWNFLGVPGIRAELDVVHATGLAIPPSPAALVATVHDLAVKKMPEVVPAPWRTVYRRGLRLAVKRAKVICTPTEAVKKELVETYRLGEEKIVVTPEAADLGPDSPRNEGALEKFGIRKPYILNVGTVEPRKNQTGLVHAYRVAEGRLRDYSLVIAGTSGWGAEELAAIIDMLGIKDRVILTGRLSSEDLAALYSQAAIFAFPSLYEGFGIPLLEAMAFGIPSISGNCEALKEVGGGAALYVEPKDAGAIAEGLIGLVNDGGLRRQLAMAGPARAAQFSWESTAARTQRAYARARAL
jgi:glycosyltransferase involved in cell wall biosynthesis